MERVLMTGDGAGRFAGASGTDDFVVTVDPLTGGFELTVVGTINH